MVCCAIHVQTEKTQKNSSPPQDSEALWPLSPPAVRSLASLLVNQSLTMRSNWVVMRDNPPQSSRGGYVVLFCMWC